MLVKIFKIVSSVILMGILVLLIIKRDLYVLVEDRARDAFNTSPSLHEAPSVPVASDLLIEQATSSITTAPPSAKVVESPALVTPSSKEVTSIPKDTAYMKMVESTSDTDESYRPVVSPCKVTMGFKIGTFDTRFGISKAEFIKEIQESAKVWGETIDKQLFVYDENGSLTINLIFDERQARTVDISYFALEIENAKTSAQEIKDSYEREKDTYLQEGEVYTKDSEAFKALTKSYEDKVAEYNTRGGATRSEYDAMMLELAKLQTEAKTLDERRQKLLLDMEAINAKVIKYNEFVAYINGLIKKSNSLGAKKFTEGRFSPSTNTIDIYQFSDRVKLRRVIIHELGHVLGINHNENVYSIMYSVNSGKSTELSKEDLASLKEACPQ